VNELANSYLSIYSAFSMSAAAFIHNRWGVELEQKRIRDLISPMAESPDKLAEGTSS
jgi:hypothetical protein